MRQQVQLQVHLRGGLRRLVALQEHRHQRALASGQRLGQSGLLGVACRFQRLGQAGAVFR